MTCYSIDGLVPIVDRSAYVHPTAFSLGACGGGGDGAAPPAPAPARS